MSAEPLLGRTDELAVIDGFLAGVPGDRRLLVISGDAGIGKTSLWQAALARAEARGDLTILVARASEAERDLAHVTLTDLLEPIVDDANERTADELPGPQRDALDAAMLRGQATVPTDPRTIGMAALSVLRRMAQERPIVVFIDDAQWVDQASAAALGFALRRLSDATVKVVATVRTGEGESTASFLDSLRRDPGASELHVGPVSLGVLHHLIVDRVGTTLTRPQLARVEAASAGNPLLAIELARGLARLDRWPLARRAAAVADRQRCPAPSADRPTCTARPRGADDRRRDGDADGRSDPRVGRHRCGRGRRCDAPGGVGRAG